MEHVFISFWKENPIFNFIVYLGLCFWDNSYYLSIIERILSIYTPKGFYKGKTEKGVKVKWLVILKKRRFMKNGKLKFDVDSDNENRSGSGSKRTFILIILLTLDIGLIFIYFRYLFLSPPFIKIFGLVVLLYFIYLTVDYYRNSQKNR